MKSLISIITPIYNAESYLAETIGSVLSQSHSNWELILINDGSTDRSFEVVKAFDDPRIRYFEQKNAGVSAARNVGLRRMKGDFFCFLDADDTLPKNSISSRLEVFQNSPNIHFVDGKVAKWNWNMSKKLSEWKPSFNGNPLNDLLNLRGHSFFGPSWMIKRKRDKNYLFNEGLTHGEDLLFYANLARDADSFYAFTDEIVLNYRVHSSSAMRGSLNRLENSYRSIYCIVNVWPEVSPELAKQFKRKTQQIMFKSYLSKGQIFNAFKVLL